MGDYRRLECWTVGHRLTLAVYRATELFPKHEMYGLTRQLRRSAASVPANIAEGAGRNTPADYARFCRIAMGSANELDYHLLLARDLGYLDAESYGALSQDARRLCRMLAGLVRSLAIADSR